MKNENEENEITFFSSPIESSADWSEIHSVVHGKLVVCFQLLTSNEEGFSSFFSDCRPNKTYLLLAVSQYFHTKSESPMFMVEIVESQVTYWAKSFDELNEAVEFCNHLLSKTNECPLTLIEINKEDFDKMVYNGEDMSIYYQDYPDY